MELESESEELRRAERMGVERVGFRREEGGLERENAELVLERESVGVEGKFVVGRREREYAAIPELGQLLRRD